MNTGAITGSPVAARGASPVDLKDAAVEPVEAACEQAGSFSQSECIAEKADPVPMSTDVTMSATSGDDSGPVITQSMLEEEKLLHEKTLHQEEEMKHKREEAIAQWDEDIREQRYKRLEFLLSKSQMYTSYLVERMKNQAAEEEKRKARREKRTARETEKKNKEVNTQQQQLENNSQETTPSSTEDAKTNSAEKMETVPEKDCSENPAESTPQVAPGRRSSRRACLGTNSSSNKPQKTDSAQTAKPTGRSRKRKQPDGDEVENFKISDYFNEALARSKRQKTEKVDKGGEGRDDSDDDKNNDVKKNERTNNASEEVEKISESETSELEPQKELNTTAAKEQTSSALTGRQFKGQPIPDGQPELFTGGILRQYQLDGFSWLRVLYENGVNGILADEMGLGKTIQCIALISHLVQYGVTGPFLVCAPLSTVPNWVSEFANFAPKVPVILYHGKKEERVFLRRQMNKKVKVDNNSVYPVVITSYEISMNDRKYMQHMEWKYLIVDEGHRIKNFQCKLIQELKLYRSTHRLLLTGTPLQNNLAELWSLLNFLLPEIFDDLGSFEAWFDIDYLDSDDGHEMIVREEQRNSVLSMLHQILMPFMLRRLKTDVCLAIPPKREVLVYAPLMKEQDEIYRAVINNTIKAWVDRKQGKDKVEVELDQKGRPKRRAAKRISYEAMEDDSNEPKKTDKKISEEEKADAEEKEMESWVKSVSEWQRKREQWNSSGMEQQDGLASSELNIQLRNTLWILRKSCNHPYLVEYPLTAGGQFKIDECLVKCSGKLMLLDKMLQSLKQGGHKVLLFSQMTAMLDILEDYCFLRKYGFCRLDGSTSLDERREQIQDFNKDPEMFIFLLSTRAGGLGINLTAADTVVIFDSDWNPQCDLQAQDRCHRIGQTRPVMVYRLVTSNTIDQRIVERAASKRRLEKIVIHKGKFKEGMGKFSANSLAPLTPQELIKLLKSTDYDEVVKGSGEDVISEGDLQKLLDREDLCRLWKQRESQSLKESSDETKEMGKPSSSPLPPTTDKRDIEGVFKVISEDIGGGAAPNTEKDSTSPHTLFSELAKTSSKDTEETEVKSNS